MNTWAALLQREIGSERHTELQQFIAHERLVSTVFPPAQDVYAALDLTSFESTKVVILGQDPYHGNGQAHGLSFSVRSNTPIPPSLRNIFKELFTDVAIQREQNGDLTGWARQGVLLLNTTLITQTHHVVIESAHPSPLSAHRGFFGSKPFSQINSALEGAGLSPINWGQ
jgi:uracil-DNA glycosylase